ncbi:MAG: bifunctional phosphopantothenoylcysteine decarboxylase/phosphopantothenate--cysteine ligase CoaBC [Armatimonadota bacterium]
MSNLSQKRIILGVTGGIAAYKAAEVCSALVKLGACVHVVMTEHATRFVGPVTFRALTSQAVITGLWEEPQEHRITHVSLPESADLVLVAPATANIIGKLAAGIADDMLSTMLLATTAPVLIAPAMNCNMWANNQVQENVNRLKSLGYTFIEPEEGRLACGAEGAGRLASPETIVRAVEDSLFPLNDFEGTTVLITAGPTEEAIDPVRFITNRSSGKMGYAIARAAKERGAKVILISGPVSLPAPPGVELVSVRSAAEMLSAVQCRLPQAQVVIGAAAVADYTLKNPGKNKIKKTGGNLTLELAPTADIMAEAGEAKGDKLLVGFAAETENLIENAQKKLKKKHLDIIVANDVSKPGIGFGADYNQVSIVDNTGAEPLPRMPKAEVAHAILDRIKKLLGGKAKRRC